MTSWTAVRTFKLAEVTNYHIEAPLGMSPAFVFMNKASYEKLPTDLKKVIDDNAGLEAAAMFGRAMDEGDAVGLKKATAKGNDIRMLGADEVERWKTAAQPTIDSWIKEMDEKGLDGKALFEKARTLIAKYSK